MHRLKQEDKTALMITGIFAGLTIFTALFHEPWRDEAQAWLIARDLNFFGMLSQMSFEGTPALWHTILFPFAQMGLPFRTISVIALIISIAMVWVFLKYAPFSWWTKTLIVFSYHFVISYTVLARSYGLGLLLLFGILALWKYRYEKPLVFSILVALMANVSVHFTFFAAAIGALYVFDVLFQKKKPEHVAAIIIMLTGGILAVIQAFPRPENINILIDIKGYQALYSLLVTGIIPPYTFPKFLAIPLAVIAYAGLFIGLLKTPRAFFFFTASCTWLLYIMFYWAPGGPRHWALFWILLVAAYWMGTYENPLKLSWLKKRGEQLFRFLRGLGWVGLHMCLIFSVAFMLQMVAAEIVYPYSNARAMANYLEEHYPDRIIIAQPSPHSAAISAYAPELKIWHPYKNDFGSYIDWNLEEWKINSLAPEEALAYIYSNLPDPSALILTNFEAVYPKGIGLQFVHKENRNVITNISEYFFLYEIIGPVEDYLVPIEE